MREPFFILPHVATFDPKNICPSVCLHFDDSQKLITQFKLTNTYILGTFLWEGLVLCNMVRLKTNPTNCENLHKNRDTKPFFYINFKQITTKLHE